MDNTSYLGFDYSNRFEYSIGTTVGIALDDSIRARRVIDRCVAVYNIGGWIVGRRYKLEDGYTLNYIEDNICSVYHNGYAINTKAVAEING